MKLSEMPKEYPKSKFQTKFLKELLGVNATTTNTCVLLETGEILRLFAKKKIKNWKRIRKGLADAPPTVLTQESQNKDHLWLELLFVNSKNNPCIYINKKSVLPL